MRLEVNGETKDVNDNSTISDMLDSLEIKNKWVVCEVNGNIVKRDRFGSSVLKDGDRVEILQFIGGG